VATRNGRQCVLEYCRHHTLRLQLLVLLVCFFCVFVLCHKINWIGLDLSLAFILLYFCVLIHCIVDFCCVYYVLSVHNIVLPFGVIKNDDDDVDDSHPVL